MKKILLFIGICFLLFTSCSKQEKEILIDPLTGSEISMSINRFEDILFDQSQDNLSFHLKANYEEYKPLFNTSLDNPEYLQMINHFAGDSLMISAYCKVKQRYPNLDWVSNQVTEAFAILIKDYPNTKIPKLYSFMFGPADFSYSYSRRIAAEKDFITIAIDLYSINTIADNHLYAQFPKYMMAMLDSAYIVPDIIHEYLRNVITRDIEPSEQSYESRLLDVIIERGKYYYALKHLLPKSSMYSILRYTKDQMQWVQDNEYNIWGFIIQNNLLYSNDRPLYMHMIAEGPTTKDLEGSPSRLGDYIGYRIIENYMSKEDKTIKEMFETKDGKEILMKSSYKPKK